MRPRHKTNQGQPRVTIQINFVVLESQTIHNKFKGNQPSDFGELRFFMYLPYMAMVAILVM